MGLVIAQIKRLATGRWKSVRAPQRSLKPQPSKTPSGRTWASRLAFVLLGGKVSLNPEGWKQEGTSEAARNLPKRIKTLLIVGKQIEAAHCKWILFAHHQVLSAHPSRSGGGAAWRQMGSRNGSPVEAIKWRFFSNCLSLRPLSNSD